MKKTFLCLLLGALCTPCTLTAQLKVQSDGTTKGTIFYSNTVKNNETVFSKRVGLSLPSNTQTPNSVLSVGSFGTPYVTAYLDCKTKVGIQITHSTSGSGPGSAIGLQSVITNGVHDSHSNYTPYNLAVRAIAGDSQSVSDLRSYSVSALLNGPKGSALYAGTTPFEFTHEGRYAAYINGNATVQNGTLNAVVAQYNDSTLMSNAAPLDETLLFDKIEQLQPLQYTLLNKTYSCPTLTLGGERKDTVLNYFSDEFASRLRYGFDHKQLKSAFPELVYALPDQTEGADYTALVPILLEGVKLEHRTSEALKDSLAELSLQLAQAQTLLIETISELEALKKQVYGTPASPQAQGDTPSLSQNTPNPFTESTEIDIYLPAGVQSAYLFIYDLTGEEQEEFVLTTRGNITQTIEGGSFAAGHYIYTLVVDGSVIDSKHLILTK